MVSPFRERCFKRTIGFTKWETLILSFSFVLFILCTGFSHDESIAGKDNHNPDLALSEKQSASTILSQASQLIAPIAIPVITQEESEKSNQAAYEYTIETKEKIEPFYRLYEEASFEIVSFEGTVRAISLIPDPAKNDYPNCLYTLFIDVDSVLSTNKESENVPCEVLVNVPIMKDKVIIDENRFRPGDMVLCKCAEYDIMPQAIQEIQLSDDIQSFEHQQYYTLTINKISRFQTTGNKTFAKREITILPIQSLPKDENAERLRAERIQSEIARIEKELQRHGGSFEAWKEEYKPIAEKYQKLCNEKWKGWINDSYFAAIGLESSYKTQEYINGILPYKKYLDDNNIDLIVVRVPSRGDFAARVLAADDFQENPAWVEHYYECLKNDIEIIDPMPEMWNHRFDLPLFYYYNDDQEAHPFEGTYYYAARLVANALRRYQYDKEEQVLEISRVSHDGKQLKYIYPAGNTKYKTPSNIEYYQVLQNEQPFTSLPQDSDSPFLFLSNSFFGRYLIPEIGLPIYASYFLQKISDWVYQDGNTGLLRDLISHQTLLNHRRAVIMVGHPKYWIEQAPFPKYYSDHARTITYYESISPDKIQFSSSDFYSFSISEKGVLTKRNPTPIITFDLDIPSVPAKETCMVRFNFNRSAYSIIRMIDPISGEILDQVETPAKIPLFVYLSVKVPRSKQVRFEIDNPAHDINFHFDIKDLELWYY